MSATDKPGIEVDTIEASFAAIAPQAEKLVKRFYEELFDRHPEVKPIFAEVNMADQRSKFLAALKLVVVNLRSPETMVPVLEEMGRRHQEYGADADHFAAVTRVLLDVMQEIAGPVWTPTVEAAWSGSLEMIAGIMLGAYTVPAESANDAPAERRAADRPWSKSMPEAVPCAKAPARKSASGGGDQVWERI